MSRNLFACPTCDATDVGYVFPDGQDPYLATTVDDFDGNTIQTVKAHACAGETVEWGVGGVVAARTASRSASMGAPWS